MGDLFEVVVTPVVDLLFELVVGLMVGVFMSKVPRLKVRPLGLK